MSKLTLEHIAPYLPYGVKCCINSNTDNSIISIISGATTEYIIIDGEHEYIDYSDCKLLLNTVKEFDRMYNDFDLSTDFETSYVTNRTDIAFVNTSDKTYLSDIKTVSNFLFKNKIDVFGLIEKGLAVDINTIQ